MKYIIIISVISLAMSFRKDDTHFIKDKVYRQEVQSQFNKRMKLYKEERPELFSIFNKNITTEQREALQFLYAYMPLSDLADYDGYFFLKQVNTALLARKTFSWGKNIPDSIFRHFVLPYRVNNEDLDSARVVFFNDLKHIVKNMSMKDAVMEVNYWCRQKVNYEASDIRTSAPLALVANAAGRCGEESTFTVTALRSVCIPARQVYTPRWAHTDDNHAWVEAYVDGKWQYLGACEPEPELNVAWFNKPVKRSMMVHTSVFGNYEEDSNSIDKGLLYNKINTLDNYTKTRTMTIKVVNQQSYPVENAEVSFGIYNYAEFYPMVVKQTDQNGLATINTGLGDLLISASKGNKYGYTKAIGTDIDTTIVVLKKMEYRDYIEDIDIFPPVELSVQDLSNKKKEANTLRLAKEDSVRNAYKKTFMQSKESEELAIKLGLNVERVKEGIARSRGNWRAIRNFLQINARDSRVLDLLEVLYDKDIRDTPEKTLTAHLKATALNTKYPVSVYNEGILNMRLQNELLRAWKPFLQSQFDANFVKKAQTNIKTITNWIESNIVIDTTANYARCPISPIGSFKLRTTDKQGRNLLFVAMARSFDIPARINIATSKPQYYVNGEWTNVTFEKITPKNATSILILKNSSAKTSKPKYYSQFTLQKFINNKFQTLDYERSNLFANFPAKLQLEPGYYCLMTGNRDNNGNVSVKRKFFTIKDGETIQQTIDLRPTKKNEHKIGNIDLSINISKGKSMRSLVKDKGMVISILEPYKEPTRHVMVDIPILKNEFDAWGGTFLFIVPESKKPNGFNFEEYKGLPSNHIFLEDKKDIISRKIRALCTNTDSEFYPIVLFVNPKGEITFLSTGYRIGIGENILKVVRE